MSPHHKKTWVIKKKKAEALRHAGNAKYSANDLESAARLYSECLALDPSNHFAFGNRSACYLRSDCAEEAHFPAWNNTVGLCALLCVCRLKIES